MASSSVSLWILFITVCTADGFMEYWISRCDFNSSKLEDIEFTRSTYYNKFEYARFSSSLNKFVGFTEPYVVLYSMVPSSGHHPAMLVCSVYDFYPKTIKVTWFRDEKEVTSDVTSTDEMENGDWFYQVHSHLEYTPRSGEKISCVVEHASLKEPLRTYWDPSMPESERNKIAIGASGLVLGLVLSLAGFIYYKRKARGRTLVPTTN